MQVTETLSDGLRRSFNVVVPASDIEGKCTAKLADLSKTLRLPGFRPGRVPMNLVRQRYGSAVMAEVMQDAINHGADQLIGDRGLRTAGQPRIGLVGEPKMDARAPSDLSFNVDLDLLPEITLPDLSTVSLTRLRAEPTAEQIDETLARLASQQREMVEITEDRGAENGDVLVIDFTGSIDGVAFQGGTGGDVNVELGAAGFIPGFAEQLEGLRAGETRDIEVTFPETYQATEMAGKTAKFAILAKALRRPVAVEIDDALAAKFGFESLDKLRELVTQQIQREYDQQARLRLKRELLDVLAEKADFPAPQNLLDIEFGAIWQRVEADQGRGEIDEEDRGKDSETLRAEYLAIADRRVRLGLLLSEIGQRNAIGVDQAELNLALRTEAGRYPGQEMQVIEFFRKNPQAVEQLRGPIFEDKVVDHILSVAQVQDRLVSPAELNDMPPLTAASPAIAPPPDAPQMEQAVSSETVPDSPPDA